MPNLCCVADCDRWYSLDEPKLAYDVARYGHTAVAYDNQMFVFGGFNGELLRDLLVYKPGEASSVLWGLKLHFGVQISQWSMDAKYVPFMHPKLVFRD